jgi:nitrite reductase (NO-forming)
MLRTLISLLIGLAAMLGGCATVHSSNATVPLTTRNMGPLKGQQATCGGPRKKTFNIDVIETTVDLGMGTSFEAWTYNGQIPAPTIEACEGDDVVLNVNNKGTTSHGLDTHAFRIDARHYSAVAPGKTLIIEKTVETPGVFMYHCASGPVTDFHIKSGIHGAMIVYPRNEKLRRAREIAVVEDAIYGTRDEKGLIPGTDPAKAQKGDEAFSMFNGRMDNDAVRVDPGDLVRMYFVNVGPGVASAHVIGTILDRVYDGKTFLSNVQTYGVAPGSGVILEFYIPEAGVYPFVDHDKLAYLPYGLALPFATNGVPASAH